MSLIIKDSYLFIGIVDLHKVVTIHTDKRARGVHAAIKTGM
jgi:hypothetical protein